MPRKDPEEHKAYDREYHARNKGRWPVPAGYSAEVQRRYKLRHPDRVLASAQKGYMKKQAKQNALRGTPEWKENEKQKRIAKLEVIAGRPKSAICELCGDGEDRIVFDHNHNTGKFRGWICNNCNAALGHVRDNTALLYKMIDYLKLNADVGPQLEKPISIQELVKNLSVNKHK